MGEPKTKKVVTPLEDLNVAVVDTGTIEAEYQSMSENSSVTPFL